MIVLDKHVVVFVAVGETIAEGNCTCTCKEQGTFYSGEDWNQQPRAIQLTLVISNSLISNNRLSRSENLVPA